MEDNNDKGINKTQLIKIISMQLSTQIKTKPKANKQSHHCLVHLQNAPNYLRPFIHPMAQCRRPQYKTPNANTNQQTIF